MKNIVKKLIKKKLKISFAESCTGGMLAASITSINGASKIFNIGLITYSNQAKIDILKVNKNVIKKYGAVSAECCEAMVKNLAKISKAQINVSVTGIAGPNGGTKNKPVGLQRLTCVRQEACVGLVPCYVCARARDCVRAYTCPRWPSKGSARY